MPRGEPGEICIAGPQVMTGYWNKPQETEGSFVGRYFRTGDVGYMDEDGYIFIVDRIKDMINASGFKVYPRRIEDALYEHSAVAEVTVVGIPDEYRGEAPKAFVKLKEGKEATAAELLQFLSGKLSKIELPAEIEFRDRAAQDHGRQAVEEGTPRRGEALIGSGSQSAVRTARRSRLAQYSTLSLAPLPQPGQRSSPPAPAASAA